jgi:hypothetical protein
MQYSNFCSLYFILIAMRQNPETNQNKKKSEKKEGKKGIVCRDGWKA